MLLRRPGGRKRVQQARQREVAMRTPIDERFDQVQRQQRAEIPAPDPRRRGLSLMDAYCPSSSMRWYRKVRASASTVAGQTSADWRDHRLPSRPMPGLSRLLNDGHRIQRLVC
jgi:hypothetical protein